MPKLLIALLLLPLLARAAGEDVDPYARFTDQGNDYDESLKELWIEQDFNVEQGPEEADLTRLDVANLPPGMTLYADLENLDVDDEDHVSRLWLVVKSRSGVANGSFEGVRCATDEYKVYAYFNPKRSEPLRMVRLPRWRPLRPDTYRAELANKVLCADTTPRKPDRVRAQPFLLPGETGYHYD